MALGVSGVVGLQEFRVQGLPSLGFTGLSVGFQDFRVQGLWLRFRA